MPHKNTQRLWRLVWVPILIGLTVLAFFGTYVPTSGASFTVSRTDDDAAPCVSMSGCTLRGAIIQANTLGGSHTINMGPGIYRLSISPGVTSDDGVPNAAVGDLDILSGRNITINGNNATIEWSTSVSPNERDRVFDIQGGGAATISNVTLRFANADFDPLGNGGAIRVLTNGGQGTLVLRNSTLRENRATNQGGHIWNAGRMTLTNVTIDTTTAGNFDGGGGIFNSGTAIILNSTIKNNGTNGPGGGIYNAASGVLAINRSLITNNTSGEDGGGIFNLGIVAGNEGNSAPATNLTFHNNRASGGGASGGAIFNGSGTTSIQFATITDNTTTLTDSGGGLHSNGGIINVKSTILSTNTPRNCSTGGGAINSQGYNLVVGATCSFSLVGPGDFISTSANLGPLQNNGGPTQTRALLTGSPAINAGSSDCPSNRDTDFSTFVDQRELGRPVGSACDIGAFEFGVSAPAAPTSQVQTCATVVSTVPPFGVTVTPTPSNASIGTGQVGPNEHRFIGVAFLDGQVICNGVIEARIGGFPCGVTRVGAAQIDGGAGSVSLLPGRFVLDVGCGPTGAEIEFFINGYKATDTAIWTAGTLDTNRELKAYTRTVTPAASATPTQVPTGTPGPSAFGTQPPSATGTAGSGSGATGANGASGQGGATWLSAPPPVGQAICPPPGSWRLMYWGGAANTPISTAAPKCPDTDRFWINRTGAWFGFAPSVPDASDSWAAFAGEAHFGHGFDSGLAVQSNGALVTPTPPPAPTALPRPNFIMTISHQGQKVEQSDEFVEITNGENYVVSLTGWYLIEEATGLRFDFPAGFSMTAGQTCRIYTNEYIPEWCGLNWKIAAEIWQQSGNGASLYNQVGERIERSIYGSFTPSDPLTRTPNTAAAVGTPTPTATVPPVSGISSSLTNPLSSLPSLSATPSGGSGGASGGSNSNVISNNGQVSLRVSAVGTAPNQADEYVEFTNMGSTITTDGWYLVNDGTGKRFDFPAGLIVEAMHTCRIYTNQQSGEFCGLNWQSQLAVWDDTAGTVSLYNGLGERVARISYSNA